MNRAQGRAHTISAFLCVCGRPSRAIINSINEFACAPECHLLCE